MINIYIPLNFPEQSNPIYRPAVIHSFPVENALENALFPAPPCIWPLPKAFPPFGA